MAAAHAPIALFAYNRPEHLRRALSSLAANPQAKQSELYIFSDGARDADSTESVSQVRNVIAGAAGFKSVTPVLRERNLGLARSIIDGVSRLCGAHGKVIVVEDDLVLSPHFLAYMNDALLMYEHEDRVISVHGYVYPINAELPETFFLRGADCWGWATWQRGWSIFEQDGSRLLERIKESGLANEFDFDGNYGYTRMLEEQIAGKNDSWAIRWHASAFLANKLTLYPGRSLVMNMGADGSGTHFGSTTTLFDVQLAQEPVKVARLPIEENSAARQLVVEYFRGIRPTFVRRMKNRAQKLFQARSSRHA